MRQTSKNLRQEIKRMRASLKQLQLEKQKKLDRNNCLKCKEDAGKNFILIYKKDHTLKGKVCSQCFENKG
ncbi:hypothetical protein HZB00_04100 [Candidatus Woesearchaeota archaeon]|nr:hypothetical protein [Candidatus Woesearchaeota archaeon]